MRVFIAVLVLIFSLQSWTKADDISDFEVEGMSIGDSLLDYFGKSEIDKNKKNYYKDNKYIPIYIEDKINFDNYDGVQFHIDKNFKIIALEGVKRFDNNFKDCQKKQNEIDQEFKDIFSNTSRDDVGIKSYDADSSGNSKYKAIYYDFESGDYISISCYDWTKEMKFFDNLRISITSKELQDWINNEAYN
jgi:hypothetical protein